MSEIRYSRRLDAYPSSVWETITDMVARHNAVNLGKGFPNWPAPSFIKDAAVAAIEADMNQYTRSKGHPRLVRAIASTFSPLLGRAVDADREVLVTVGACEALFLSIVALVDPGDEVIVLEPYFDFYPAQVRMAGGTPVFVPLRYCPVEGEAPSSAHFRLDMAELEAAVSDRTRMIIVNTPHNPTGKVFNRKELEAIAAFCKSHNLVAISDEVYEWMVYDGNEHVRLGSLDGMWERTLTIGSGGKTFSVTGWKIGWVMSSAFLIDLLWKVHQNTVFTMCTPLQEAAAVAFEHAQTSTYFADYTAELLSKRNKLAASMRAAGITPIMPQGSYFMVGLTDSLDVPVGADDDGDLTRDFRAAYHLIRRHRLATIPPSAFYSDRHKHLAASFLRFCFCKTDDVLDEAAQQLSSVRSSA